MGSITANLGMGSGKLTGETIEKLKAADRAARVAPTEKRIEKEEKKTESINTLTTSISEVQQTQSQLSSEVSYQKRKPDVQGDSVSVSVDDGVPVQSMTIDVKKLASNDIYESKGFSTKDDIISEEDALLTFSTEEKEYNIKLLGGTTLKNLPSILDKQTEGKIKGTILNTGGIKPFKLMIKSTETGMDSKIFFGEKQDSFEIDMSNFPMVMGPEDLIINGTNIFDEYFSITDLYTTMKIDDKDYEGLEIVAKYINDKSSKTGVSASLNSSGTNITLSNIKGQNINLSGNNDILKNLGLVDGKKLSGSQIDATNMSFDLTKDLTIKNRSGEDVVIMYEGDSISSFEDLVDEINYKFENGEIDVSASITLFANGNKAITLNIDKDSDSELSINGDAGNLSELGIASSENTYKKGNSIDPYDLDFYLNRDLTINDINGKNVTILSQGDNISDLDDIADEINELHANGRIDIKAFVTQTDTGSYITLENMQGGPIKLGLDDHDLEQLGLDSLENVGNTEASTNKNGTQVKGDKFTYEDFEFSEAFLLNGITIYEAGDNWNSTVELVNKINAQKGMTGVEAHLVSNYDGTQSIILENPDNGDISIEGNNSDLNKFGLTSKTKQSSAKSLGVLGLSNIQKASDAIFNYNGARVVRNKNEIDDMRVGIHIKLLQEGESNINIGKDFDLIKASIKSFVEGYNTLGKNIEALTKFDKENNTIGQFQGISEISNIMHRLNKHITKYNSKLEIKSMMEIGVDINKDGIMSLDEGKLNAALEKNSEDVEKLVRGYTKDFLPTSVKSSNMKKDEFKVGFGSDLMLNINGHTFFTKSDDPINISYDSSKGEYTNLIELVKKINSKTDITNIEADIDKESGALIIKHLKGSEISFDKSNSSVLSNLGLSGKRAFAVSKNHVKGVFANVNDYFDSLIDGDKAILSQFSQGLDDNLKTLKEDKEKALERLDTKYATMANQFASYDSVIAKMKNSFKQLDMQIKYAMNKKD